MKKIISVFLVSLILSINPTLAKAKSQQEQFCEGYEKGYKTVSDFARYPGHCPNSGSLNGHKNFYDKGFKVGAEKACGTYPNHNLCR